jgi:hypothetical protein
MRVPSNKLKPQTIESDSTQSIFNYCILFDQLFTCVGTSTLITPKPLLGTMIIF